jgi:hypothetical protein
MSDTKTIYLAVTVPVTFMPEHFAQNIRELVQGYSDAIYVNIYETADAISHEADRIKAQEYAATVDDVVKSILDAVKAGEVTDRDDLETRLHEEIDSHHDVIYTYAAMQVIMQSPNSGAYFEELGAEGAVEDNEIQWSKLAYMALLADVRDELFNSDEIDINEDDLGWFTCEDCEKRFRRTAWESDRADLTDTCTECAEKHCTECSELETEHDVDCSLNPDNQDNTEEA